MAPSCVEVYLVFIYLFFFDKEFEFVGLGKKSTKSYIVLCSVRDWTWKFYVLNDARILCSQFNFSTG